ncbi:MAG: 3D domain-containing protein [Candidatus Omnitrophica bacterium]|nr:3D domain-containing protein [Candidatus Omnitrophota bacterium]
MAKKSKSFFLRLTQIFFSYILIVFTLWSLYYAFWGRHLYLVTAYCSCPICINVKKYHDGQFASGKKIYWGGIAADPSVPFGSRVELMPLWPQDWNAVFSVLQGKRKFRVEDRGGKIKGKHIDLFIPDSLSGHKAALKWGARRMRIKLNGQWAE